VDAAHPALTVVAAHFGWPWQMELVALHKSNVYIDVSGWSPQRIPAELSGKSAAGCPTGSSGVVTFPS